MVVSAVVAPAPAPAVQAVRITAVGDIACKHVPSDNHQACRYDDVAAAIARGNYERFLALGDIQYEYGEYANFVDNYNRYFGRLLPITEPAPGNHDYGTPGAHGYYRYFGRIGQEPTATTRMTSAGGTSSR